MRRTWTLALLVALPLPAAAQDAWPQFRGAASTGVAEGALPEVWDTKKNVAWVADVPGRGWSSPVVWGEKVFVTAVLNDKKPPDAKRGLYIENVVGKPQPGNHEWVTYCFDFRTGKQLWKQTAHKGEAPGPIHIKNSYASETPATDGERLYVYFGNLGLFCYDLNGKELWSRKWGSFPTRFGWGTGASPVVHKGRVYVVNDNEKESFLVALDAATGKELWKVTRDEKSNWATPFVWENEKRTEIVTAGTGKVRSYGLDGKLLWEFKGMSDITIPTPCAKDGLLYVSSGYILNSLKPLYAIRPGAAGDISLGKDQTSNEHIVWCQRRAAAYHPSHLVYEDYVYVLLDKGFLSCYDAKTGKEVYDRKRLHPDSDKFCASPWAAGGKIFCLSEDGDTYVVRAGPKFEVLGKNSLDEMCLATPAAARGSLFVRTLSKLYRIDNTAK